MKVFLTGGSGFVGRNLISYLLEHGDSVVALSRSERSDGLVEKAASGGTVQIFRGDVNVDIEALTKGVRMRPAVLLSGVTAADGMAGCDTVIHGAAKVSMWGPWEGFQHATVDGTANMLKAAHAAGVSRFVHIGTEAVLIAHRQIHNADETWPTPEPSFYAPYSTSKQLSERAVLEANDPDGGFSTVVVRPRFIWGRGDTVLLPSILKKVDAGQWRFFSPRYKTSTCHVRNVIEGTHLAAVKGRPGEVYFLTDGEPVDLEQFVGDMLEARGRIRPTGWRMPFSVAWAIATVLESLPFLGFGPKREAPIKRQFLGLLACEMTLVDDKARRELGYKAHVGRAEGLQEMREEYAQQQQQQRQRLDKT